MKKCAQCGREYADDVTVCVVDNQPLISSSPPVAPTPFAPARQPLSTGVAITSMVLGITSLIICFIGPLLGIPAVVCGHIALSRANRTPSLYGGRGYATTGLITGYIGIAFLLMIPILAGLLLPALARAKEKAIQINCASNLKQISVAARVWSADHDDLFPTNFMDLTNELSSPRVLLCPADQFHKRPFGKPLVWNANNVSYEFLTPGLKESEITNQVVFRCPIHGTEVMGDGTVRFKTSNRSVN